MIEFIKKYKKYIIVIGIILLIAGVFIVKQVISNNSDYNPNANYTMRMYNFGMVGCTACKQVEPVYNKIKEKYKNEIEFKEVDVNKDSDLANKFNVEYTPTFVITKLDGDILTGFIGVGTEAEFDQYIDKARSMK